MNLHCCRLQMKSWHFSLLGDMMKSSNFIFIVNAPRNGINLLLQLNTKVGRKTPQPIILALDTCESSNYTVPFDTYNRKVSISPSFKGADVYFFLVCRLS